MKKALLFLLCIISIGYVKAYENQFFQIDIPENYTEEKLNGDAFKWNNGNKYMAVTVTDNSETQYNVKYFTSVAIEKQKEYLEKNLTEGLSEYDIKVGVSDIKKVHDKETDGYYLEYTLLFPNNEKTGHPIYQKGRMYTTEHLITTIVYSSDTEIENDEECKNVMNSLKILDNPILGRNINLKSFFATIIIVGVILGIISAIKSEKKRQ